jgi:hypothetical protein
MRRTFQTWQWRHPETDELLQTVSEASGEDLGWFFDQVMRTDQSLDYRLVRARSVPAEPFAGFTWIDGERTLIPAEGSSGERDGVGSNAAGDHASDVEAGFETTVVVHRLGGILHPVEVELRFEDGTSTRLSWDGTDRWRRWQLHTDQRLAEAELDPDHVMLLDVSRLDNSIRIEPSAAASSKILTHFIFWLQNLLATSDILG